MVHPRFFPALILLLLAASACTGSPAQPFVRNSAPSPAAPATSAPSPEAPAASAPSPQALAQGEASPQAPATTSVSASEKTATSTPVPEETSTSAPSSAEAATDSAPALAIPPEVAKLIQEFDPNHFSHPTQIDNPWLPMKPGTRRTQDGTTIQDDGTALPHRLVLTVTDLTKVIGGVPSVVLWIVDYQDAEVAESELAFFAQDDDGRVWRMGEYPEVYENGKIVEAPAWIHGVEDARAGVAMLADPQPGTPRYAQGWGPAVDWTDQGQVDQVGQKTCVPAGCYEDALVIAETSQSEPDAEQLKYYARNAGNVRVGWRGAGEKTKETLELVKAEQLSEEELAEVRAEALKLEQSAYKVSPEVYGQTLPVEQAPGAAGE